MYIGQHSGCGMIPESRAGTHMPLDRPGASTRNAGMDAALPGRRVINAGCPHDCPDTCALAITVENGNAISVKGGDMPFTAGTLCTKVARDLDRTYARSRLLHPLKQIGAKAQGQLRRIGWDEALDTITARFKAIAADDPQQILPVSYAGTMGMVSYASIARQCISPSRSRGNR